KTRSAAWCSTRSASRQRHCGHQPFIFSRSLMGSCRAPPAARSEPRLDGVPDFWREVDPVEPCDLLDPGRRSYVDLGHVVSDYIDADKDQPLLSEARTDRGADLV